MMGEQSKLDILRCAFQCHDDRITALSLQLSKVSEEMAALRDCLLDAGVVASHHLEKRIQRRRFAQIAQMHQLPHNLTLSTVIQGRELARAIMKFAGFPAVSQLTATTQGLHASMVTLSPTIFSCSIYAVGGHDDEGRALNSMDRYLPRQGIWEETSPMSIARGGCAAVALLGKVYVMGGMNTEHEATEKVEVFDASTEKWTACPGMQTARVCAVAAPTRQSIYIFGGSDGNSTLCSGERLELDASNGCPSCATWIAVPPMQDVREAAASVGIGRHIYVAGGWAGNEALKSVERLDLKTSTWQTLPPMTFPRGAASAVAVRRCLLVVGGHDGTSCPELAERFDPESGIWETGMSMRVPRAAAGAAIAYGSVYVFGGVSGRSSADIAECYDLATKSWGVLPAPTTRRRRFGLVSCRI